MTVRGELLNKSIPWKEAHDKLIPNHSPNQCRMHWLNVIYKPETQVYLNALVQSWRAVWLVRRGFGPLAEFDDRSMTGIDIRAQIRELRHTVHASVAYVTSSSAKTLSILTNCNTRQTSWWPWSDAS